MKLKLALVVVGVACGSMSTGSARAVVALTNPNSTVTGYTTPVVFVPSGQEMTFTNGDIDAHDIRSQDTRPDGSAAWCVLFPSGGCPLFYSDLIGLGETSPVFGVAGLNAGEYQFYCGPHPWMTGTLIVR